MNMSVLLAGGLPFILPRSEVACLQKFPILRSAGRGTLFLFILS